MLSDEEATILRTLFTPGSRKFWELKTAEAQVLYMAILKHRDADNRLEGRPKDLKALVPKSSWSLKKISAMVNDLMAVGLILKEESEDGLYIQIVVPKTLAAQFAQFCAAQPLRAQRNLRNFAQSAQTTESTRDKTAHFAQSDATSTLLNSGLVLN